MHADAVNTQVLRQLIIAATGPVAAMIRPGDRLHEDLGMDSLEMADLLVEIDIRFGVVISSDHLADIHTVADLENAVSLLSCG